MLEVHAVERMNPRSTSELRTVPGFWAVPVMFGPNSGLARWVYSLLRRSDIGSPDRVMNNIVTQRLIHDVVQVFPIP